MNMKTSFATAARVSIASAIALALGACMGSTASPQMASRHLPTVSQSTMAFDVDVSGGVMSDRAQTALAEWLDSVGVRYGDRITIDDPNPGASQRRAAVAAVLSNYGLLLASESSVTAGQIAPGTARVVLTRAAASVPACPDWTRPSNPEFGASTMSNFGCANVSNLAAMVVDANDLVSGKTHSGVAAEETIKGINTYRKKASTGKQTVQSALKKAGKGPIGN
jgi:pilus assembly protein CpaD